MISYYEQQGQDIDGNKEQSIFCYDLTKEDIPAIQNELERVLIEDEYHYNDTVWIELMDPLTEKMVDFDVEVSEYLTREQFERIINENN